MHRTASHSKYLPGPKCQCYRWETLPQRELSWNRYIAPPHICGRCASLSPWSKYEDSRKLLGWLGQGSLEFGRHKYQYLIPSWKNSEEERLREAIGDTRGVGGGEPKLKIICVHFELWEFSETKIPVFLVFVDHDCHHLKRDHLQDTCKGDRLPGVKAEKTVAWN